MNLIYRVFFRLDYFRSGLSFFTIFGVIRQIIRQIILFSTNLDLLDECKKHLWIYDNLLFISEISAISISLNYFLKDKDKEKLIDKNSNLH